MRTKDKIDNNNQKGKEKSFKLILSSVEHKLFHIYSCTIPAWHGRQAVMDRHGSGAILSLDRSPESVPLNNSHPLAVQWASAGSSHISKYGRRSVARGSVTTCPCLIGLTHAMIVVLHEIRSKVRVPIV